ncbi:MULTISPECIES: serine hydrolase [unclassified Pseudomonas]|uniref:serine hydrolase domain-containing protein n=1 Tax=unclassified Pseudomonas TaxID=196821 RepID=UPI000C87A2FA|nr:MULTISPECIES: serine hydrolase domain-containing protein [unclassified Pseudomonas]PMU08919.1 1,4-butanediol diacrylate esterase [Pseudomonas sp. FW305-20]PMU16817.1 1,4-butanediol diacrylate esterase [Pseudomonas sp. FW305-122]PMU37792.1 1,4-butanediol diacrylate esterase [Pseudomonas sp. FW305-47B]PMX58823.1 1,4-butanediol diacrylate esterase [Pseudomonas sp. FW305-33]PMX67339.1 1,4-butanediol diacrylate esterase [Pseudomonas sp. FW305-60]
MNPAFTSSINNLLDTVTAGQQRVPGVVAAITGRDGLLYEGASGQRTLGQTDAMTTDSVFAMFSTTKAITATAVLQLVEDGRLDLDAPARDYVPMIGELKVLDGFDTDGTPRLRAPKKHITTRMLLLHTAGLGYEFFNENYNRLVQEGRQPSIISGSLAALMTPLLFEPGEQWEYGSNMDWAGLVVEAITGKRLGEVMRQRIFEPLGMTDTAFSMSASMIQRRAGMHQREEDGSLTAVEGSLLPEEPEVHMGGHGLFSTVKDYCLFIRAWLNDGQGDHGRILKPETIRFAEKNGLDNLKIKALPCVIPSISHTAEFFPGMPKSWALSFMINEQDAPTGRPAGSLAWAGLANLFYWIDRKNGIGGFWATQILPFIDPVSTNGYLDFETAAYRNLTT